MVKKAVNWNKESWVKGGNFYEFIRDFTHAATVNAEINFNKRAIEEDFCDGKVGDLTFYRELDGLCRRMKFFYETLDKLLFDCPQYDMTINKPKQKKGGRR